jgi:hypothetical protein
MRGAAAIGAALWIGTLLRPAPLLAQGGETAGLLLGIPATARAVGLGGAYAAVVGDEGSVFVNPAGLAPIRRLAVGASWERPVVGASLTSGAAALRVGRFDLGLGLLYLDFGTDSVFVPDPLSGGDVGTATGETVTAFHALAVGAVAYRRGMLSVGGSVKYLREYIGAGDSSAYSASGVGGDVGFAIAVFDIAALGAVVQNLGGDLRTSTGTPAPLPRTTRLGFTLNFIDPQGTLRLMATTDWVSPRSGESYWAFGFEGGAASGGMGLVGRVGLAAGREASDRSNVTWGGGVQVRGLRLDYAFQAFEALGEGAHRFGVRWAL